MNRSKIEWCDYTWNFITGCRHDCRYCYAKRLTARFSGNVKLNKMAKEDYSLISADDGSGDLYILDAPMLNETGNPLIYPFGFEPTLHKYRADIPGKLKMGSKIFVGAMADVFGAWVPDDWISDIFSICRKYPIHNYLFLTKNPERYERIDAVGVLPAGGNMWYGSTLTRPEDRCFTSNVHRTFWSIEPIFAPFQIWDKDEFSPDWIIIGAETGRSKGVVVPEREWIEDIVKGCDKAGIPVFMKNSLIPIVGEDNIRRDFPKQLQHSEISPRMKKRLFDICANCKTYLKKSDMITLLARSKRGEQPKQFGFMCKDCFRKFCKSSGLNLPELEEIAESITIDTGDDDG